MTNSNLSSDNSRQSIVVVNNDNGTSASIAKATESLLEAELLAAVMDEGSETNTRQLFRTIALQHTKAIGVCNVMRAEDGSWDVNPSNATGRIPRRHDFTGELGQQCETAFQRGAIQIRRLQDGMNAQAFFAPIKMFATVPEIMMLVVPEGTNHGQLRQTLDKIVAAMSLWLKGVSARQGDWKLASLAALIEIVSRVESAGNLHDAATILVNDLAKQLGCPRVAVGLKHRHGMRIYAISGNSSNELGTNLCKSIEHVVSESILRREPGVWPPAREDINSHLLLAHKQLARTIQAEAVASHSLTNLANKTIGSLVFAGSRELLHRFLRFVKATSPRVACSLDIAQRAQPSWLFRHLRSLKASLIGNRWKTVASIAAVAVLLLIMPVPYHVRCRCTAEPTVRRFAVAPYQGLIEHGFAKPGDTVKQGQVLAQMDGRAVRWELSSIRAEREQAMRKREVKLAANDISEAMLAELESKKLASREELLNHQLEQLEIRSSIDGVILSGSLERAEAASVQMGQVLFEIGLMKPLRLEIAVPAEEMAQVRAGQSVTVWIRGQEGEPIDGKIERIHPRSETRESKNIFVAEVLFANEDLRLQPGMEGNVRIVCDRRPLAWNIFHKPWNYVRTQLTWW
jgi:Barrel-sandwich domain of CusB or HlyD membrane-fusion